MVSNTHTIAQILNSSPFPPSFEGNPWIFGSALFCTMLASLISLSQIYNIIREIINVPDKISCPLNIYRFQLLLAYLTVIMGCGPDAVYLWTFNEVSAATTSNILTVDRLFDSLFMIPFLLFTWSHIKYGPNIKFQLVVRAAPLGWSLPRGSIVRTNIFTVVLIILMAVGVTLSK